MSFKYNHSLIWTPIASLPGGFLNGWTPDATNVPQIGLMTVNGIVFAVTKGLVKATSGVGATLVFTLPVGYRAGSFYYNSYAGGTNPSNTIVLQNASAVGGYDGITGAAETAGNCHDILLSYAWEVKG